MIITGYIQPIRPQDLRGRFRLLRGELAAELARRVDDPRDWRVQRLTERELLRFVLDVVDGHIYLADHVTPQRDPDAMVAVFPAAEFVRDISPDARREIGTFYEYRDKATGKTSNGQPSFSSVRFVHAEDWKRALDMIAAECIRREGNKP